MNACIIYGTHYGTTESYAKKLSEKTGMATIPYTKASNLSEYTTVIYLGGLYAGGVKGLKKTAKLLNPKCKLIICTVGLADPEDADNVKKIKDAIASQIPESLFAQATIFNLRGGIDYAKLSFGHKTMMTLLYKKSKKMPEEQRTADHRGIIETFNKSVDFVDFSTLDAVVDAMASW